MLSFFILTQGPYGEEGLTNRVNQSFSTYDSDHDPIEDKNCAVVDGAGWWYGNKNNNCGHTNLNQYRPIWWALREHDSKLSYVEMKIRPLH